VVFNLSNNILESENHSISENIINISMKTLKEIQSQIIKLTTNIETNYPELYKMLDENPITIPSKIHPDMNIVIMEDYLESLKQLLKHHLETHNSKE
jgi:hypothetical protein